jgi:hypothetical protein
MNHQAFLLAIFLIFSLALLCALGWPHLGSAPSRTAGKLRSRLPRLRHRPAAQTIAPLVVSPPLPPRLEDRHHSLCVPGER